MSNGNDVNSIADHLELKILKKKLDELSSREEQTKNKIESINSVLLSSNSKEMLMNYPDLVSEYNLNDLSGLFLKYRLKGINDHLQSNLLKIQKSKYLVQKSLQEAKICPDCNGQGSIVKVRIERDADEMPLADQTVITCSNCEGKGVKTYSTNESEDGNF